MADIMTRRLSPVIVQGYVEGKRKPGRPKSNWMDKIRTWTGKNIVDCHRLASNRVDWRKMVSSAKTLLRPPAAAMGQ